MTRIIIPAVPVATSAMKAALVEFDKRIKVKDYCRKDDGLSDLAKVMGDPSLSDWFSLGIRFIFDQVYLADASTRTVLEDNVSSLVLNRFIRDYHNLPMRLKSLQNQAQMFFSKSCVNLASSFKVQVEREAEIKQLRGIISQSKDNILARFHLVANVVFLLKKEGYLTPENELSNKERLIKNPRLFLVAIVNILHLLQNISPTEEAELSLQKIDHAIHATLKLLNITEDNEAIVFLLRDDLVEQKFLFLVKDAVQDVLVVETAADEDRAFLTRSQSS